MQCGEAPRDAVEWGGRGHGRESRHEVVGGSERREGGWRERESKQVSRKGSDTHGCHCLLYVLGRVAYFSSCTYLFGAQRISQHASQHTTQGTPTQQNTREHIGVGGGEPLPSSFGSERRPERSHLPTVTLSFVNGHWRLRPRRLRSQPRGIEPRN